MIIITAIIMIIATILKTFMIIIQMIIIIITICQQPDPPTNKPTIQRTRPIKPPSYRANKNPAPHLNTRATYFSSDVLRRGRRQRRSLQNPATEPCEVWGRVVGQPPLLQKPNSLSTKLISPSPPAPCPCRRPSQS